MNEIKKSKYVCWIVLLLAVGMLFTERTVQAASKKYVTRTDNLFVRDKGDFAKDTIKVGNKIYYTLNNGFYCYNIKTKKKQKLVKIPGGADILFYSNKTFFVANTYGNPTEQIDEDDEENIKYYYDIYKINIKAKSVTKFLNDVDSFIGYSGGKYWYIANGSLMATVSNQENAVEYNTPKISSGIPDSNYVYYVEVIKTPKTDVTDVDDEEDKYDYVTTYYKINATTGVKKKITESQYLKKADIGTFYTFPEKGVNNGRSSSISKNLSFNWNYGEAHYFNDNGKRYVQTFKKKEKINFYKGPKNKFSEAVCIFDKYVVVRVASVSGKKTANYVLLNNKGKVVGKLGSESYDYKKYTRHRWK